MASLIRSDLDFVLQQIFAAEAHAAGADPLSLVPNTFAPVGLRTVDGSYNNLMPGQTEYGAADNAFPRLVEAGYRPGYDAPGNVIDPTPRQISNLIADMTSNNPAAVQAFVDAGLGVVVDGVLHHLDGDAVGAVIPVGTLLQIPNTTPDEGLSAPFNSWFTFFGQFFDHGLDLLNKNNAEVVMIPLQPDDPLYVPGGTTNFMVMSRAAPDADGEHVNQTTPLVDQNQTYTSHASHQVFLREYVPDATGKPVATGRLLDGSDGGLTTWADVKAQALMLGIALSDHDVVDVPLLRTDAYGKFIPNAQGFAQIITGAGVDGILNTGDDTVISGTSAAPVSPGAAAVRTGHAFLNDIAHEANPFSSQTGLALLADTDTSLGLSETGTYDNELLARHFITGDGRGNENIALTAVHHVFHSEHNRQVAEVKATILATNDNAFISQWVMPGSNIGDGVQDLEWNGERLFQTARFATEMQYQHLVFEEFARKMQPNVDAFLPETNYDTTINPAIVAEFAHAVFRVGHSMLTEGVDRLSPTFVSNDVGLIEAFLNPLEFNENGSLAPGVAAGAIVRGMTRQAGNEIDEFVTDAVRTNLLGLPLDLAALNIARGRDTGVPTLNDARREFYAMTQDSQLKAYTSWTDFAQNLKHEASVINFIAAYGTHASITGAATTADKRAAATLLVMGGAGEPADRLDFLNAQGAYTTALGGVDDIDLWIGGLAEKQMPFGGLLGSTFNFVFETQMEDLQNGDRFYYLSRLAGMNFLSEMENNTFAKLVMQNTDATHLPADIFSTPGFILEVIQANQFTGLGDGHGDPVAQVDPVDNVPDLIPLVIRDNPGTVGPDANYLQYTGGDHVVLGGSAGNDTLIASIGDDTIYGDAGADRIEGGHGNDQIEGGAGDDIITDLGGDDVIKGNEGNDVIHGGNGANLIIGGGGKDFIITGEDVSEVFAGQGDDFILGSKGNLPTLGNEGNDWIELGTQDGTSGDSSDPLTGDLIRGHDVLISGGGFDELIGEGGNDIFSGSDGEDHFDGGSGFDWAIYKFETGGVTADMVVNDFIELPATPSTAGILDRFAFTEGLSGSSFSDNLRGDSADATEILQAGSYGSVLVNNEIDLITGLRAILPEGTTSFGSGNILLGGKGSDLIEGRGGNDIINGDAWLDVRIAVAGGLPGQPGITSVDSMKQLMPYMLAGQINPSQLSIVREIRHSDTVDFDTAMFSGPRANYTVVTDLDGVTTVADNVGTDGTDILRNIERLQFGNLAEVLSGTNNAPTATNLANPLLSISDASPAVNQLLTITKNFSDADNPGGTVSGPISYIWQHETVAGSGIFNDIVGLGGDRPATASGTTFRVTPDLDGQAIRVRAVYEDANGVLENVFSAATGAVAGAVAVPIPQAPPVETLVNSDGVRYIRGDLDFILEQIVISERHAAGESLTDILPNSRVAFGMRTVDGSFNNLLNGQTDFGAANTLFPRLLDPSFRNDEDGDFIVLGPGLTITNTDYASTGDVVDADPRIISNLIVDQTDANPATEGLGVNVPTPGLDGIFGTADDGFVNLIGNTAPDEGLSAPFNAWMTFFGQFFDHGLDLVSKGGNGTIFVPLQSDDPLVAGADGEFGTPDDLPASQRFLLLTRATQFNGHEADNNTTSFVDQNQTYTSNPSHQVFLREYVLNAAGQPVDTGRLITSPGGGMATWGVVKEQARTLLGIDLGDHDDVPTMAVDAYGNFIPGANGMPQIVTVSGLVEGNRAAPIDASLAFSSGHHFLNDIAHTANPFNSQTNAPLTADTDTVIGNAPGAGFYDNELLDAHYIAGDGRANENIALTAVHHVFHAEHNRLVEHTKQVVLASNDPGFIAQWLLPGANQADGIQALEWNGERLFQAARFGTEMQYQHLVFEEFARKVQPNVDIFFAATQVYDTEIDASIVAEFAHTVYRFGHSMLTETVDRFDAEFNVVGDPNSADPDQQLGLIAAFLNPLEFRASGITADEAAGALARGLTRQEGNQIDEFITEALRNNLLGLPLDLATINIMRGRDTGVPSLNAARRDFYDVTGDAQLKPYSSWVDLMSHLKNPASIVNFIAAYGTHASITGGIDARREAAMKLVFGGTDAPVDRLDFLNSLGEYVNGPSGVTTSGVDDIDFWIGGLAEKNMPFGGMLGSTFNFVFEEQMEKLQDGDRFYYLERTQGLNFLTELENNSFARMIMANTDVTHLPGDVFATPGFTLEVDESLQFTGLGPLGRDDPTGEGGETQVHRTDPANAGNPNYLRYSGDEHVVLGGTAGNDTVIASLGDDTVYGDEGNDHLEGGDGNDFVLGGAGDDIMTDRGGDDNMQGGDGNDAIHGGNGLNLILGGFGNDFIVTGEDPSEAFGGPGNDFIMGARANEFVFGNEGDDWIQHGMADGSAGENFDAFSRDQTVGHDVFIGNTISDRMDGEGGDDIMVGNGGQVDRYEGGSGFDWAVFKDDALGVTADLLLRAFDETPVPISNATVLARFTSTEGMSGSAHADVLRGDDNDAAAMALSGATGSVLDAAGIARIAGLRGLIDDALGVGVNTFAGNIILGGLGSDILEGRGGDDIIDGDAALNVRISVRATVDANGDSIADRNANGELILGAQIATANSMTEVQAAIFSGTYNPGQLTIVREILNHAYEETATDFDTAVFADVRDNYEIEVIDNPDDIFLPPLRIVVRHLDGGVPGGDDGVDTLFNVERLQFSDQAIVYGGLNSDPEGVLEINDTTPTEDQLLSVSTLGIRDADFITAENPEGLLHLSGTAVAYFWQAEVRPGIFEDILIENAGGEVARATGPTFMPRGFEVGLALRVHAIYKDPQGVLESVFSDVTAPVESNNTLPQGVLGISDTTPTETFALQAINGITDADGLPATFNFQWQQSALNGGGAFTNIAGATGDVFTPGQDQVNRQLRVVMTYTDLEGHPETVISAPTIVTGDFIAENAAGQVLNGNAGQDMILGGGGADTLNGNAEDDYLDGGAAADAVNGGAGNDIMFGGAGQDAMDGGAGNDVITAGDGADGTAGTPITGGLGDDRFVATAADGNDFYNGAGGIDTYDLSGIVAPAGVTVTTATSNGGGTGTDALAAIENVIGSQGNDTITMGAGVNVIDGQGGNDQLLGGDAGDTITGGAGDDTITGGAGADGVNGGEGNDTFVYTVGADGADLVEGGEGNDRVNFVGGAGNQSLNVLLSGAAIVAFAGASVAGVEEFSANLGAATDTLDYGASTTDVTVDLTTGAATGFVLISNIENATGGAGNDTLLAGAGANVLAGGAGNDTLNAGAGNDTLTGGAGNDQFIATLNDGNDSYTGNGGNDDTYDLSAVTVTTTVNLTTGAATSTETGTDTLATIEHVIGGSAADTITGGANANTLEGRAGADVIRGGGGADVIDGGADNDQLFGDAAADTITGGLGTDTVDGGDGADRFLAIQGDGNDSYIGGTGNDTLDLSSTTSGATVTATAASSASIGVDTLATIENVFGSQGDDSITLDAGVNVVDGREGDDTISTGAGADRVTGGAGNDQVNGGAGNDVFVFAAGFGFDTITGYDASPDAVLAQDRMDISSLGISALTFGDHVVITDLGNDTRIDIDGIENAILLIGVNGVGANAVTSADFILSP